ncbi:sigma-E factor negative regulatory protein [Salinisphaera sp.]|uniref:sigma-E factor negative regulatory protein n=1 Tax=Salinisphaera sp. TaxID=1914330 RepID=UPI002D79AD53|nr:sigma-E factor negative regulatory protein [Salinisphaera sp.]HET7314866.1 sigma-E factor negative regulatory protein [Salinisphaera sp.]
MNEQLSAFLDNEATRDEADSVVNALLRDEALRDSWTRQHWIRTTLRSHSAETVVDVDTGFANRVMAAIAADNYPEAPGYPETLAPRRGSEMPAAARHRRPRRWRGVAGVAAAASVAGVVFLTGSPFVRGGMSGGEGRMTVAGNGQTATRTGDTVDAKRQGFGAGGWNERLADFSSISAQPVRVQTVAAGGPASGMASRGLRAAAGPADHWSVSDPAVRDELNGYLVDHNGMARAYGMSSTTPALVRVAAYGQDVTQ